METTKSTVHAMGKLKSVDFRSRMVIMLISLKKQNMADLTSMRRLKMLILRREQLKCTFQENE